MKDVATKIMGDLITEMVHSDYLDDDKGPVKPRLLKIIQRIHKWTGEKISEEDIYRKYKNAKDAFGRTQSRKQEVGASQKMSYKAGQDNLKKPRRRIKRRKRKRRKSLEEKNDPRNPPTCSAGQGLRKLLPTTSIVILNLLRCRDHQRSSPTSRNARATMVHRWGEIRR